MKKITPRRSFLSTSLKALIGVGVLSSATTTKIFASESGKNDFRTKSFQNYIELKGRVFDETGRLPLPNTNIQIKFLSPDNKNLELIKNLTSDSRGNYSFLINMPQREYGRHHKVHFKLSDRINEYSTELSFNNFGAYISDKHWENNNQLEDKLLFPTYTTFLNQSSIQFNISFTNHLNL